MSNHINPELWARARAAQDDLRQMRRDYRERDQRKRDEQEEGMARQRNGNVDQEDGC